MLRLTLTSDDRSDLVRGASITTITNDGLEIEVYPPEGDPDFTNGPGLIDFARGYLASVADDQGIEPSEALTHWIESEANGLVHHLTKTVEAYMNQNACPPPEKVLRAVCANCGRPVAKLPEGQDGTTTCDTCGEVEVTFIEEEG